MPENDPLEIQVSVKLRLPKRIKPTDIPASLIDEIIAYRVEKGRDHPRATTRIIRWRNPGRKGSARNWRQGNQDDAWETLGRALKGGGIRVSVVE